MKKYLLIAALATALATPVTIYAQVDISVDDLEWLHQNCEVAFNQAGTVMVVRGKVELVLDMDTGQLTDGEGVSVDLPDEPVNYPGFFLAAPIAADNKLTELGLPSQEELKGNSWLCYKGS